MSAPLSARQGRPAWMIRVGLHALLWGAAMAASAAAHLLLARDWHMDEQARLLIALFGAGGFVGYPFARLLLVLLPGRWRPTQRFASAFIIIGAASVGFTAFFFALQFLGYFARWHDDHMSKRLMFETVFTILSACYQFLVLGLRLYMPLGLLSLLAVSTAFARRRI